MARTSACRTSIPSYLGQRTVIGQMIKAVAPVVRQTRASCFVNKTIDVTLPSNAVQPRLPARTPMTFLCPPPCFNHLVKNTREKVETPGHRPSGTRGRASENQVPVRRYRTTAQDHTTPRQVRQQLRTCLLVTYSGYLDQLTVGTGPEYRLY